MAGENSLHARLKFGGDYSMRNSSNFDINNNKAFLGDFFTVSDRIFLDCTARSETSPKIVRGKIVPEMVITETK
jgi:hypothetical protein